ncbi:MAG: STM4504/CBY_0614 family protein [Limisphaerales bacterium]
MKPLEPPDSLHLQAAQGWCELRAFAEADVELGNRVSVRVFWFDSHDWREHHPVVDGCHAQVSLAILFDYGTIRRWEMSVVKLYSKQQKALTSQPPDVYRHDGLPKPLRVQIVHIWNDAIGTDNHPLSIAERLFEDVRRTLCKEYGVSKLTTARQPSHLYPASFRKQVEDFFLTCKDVARCLDVIQLIFNVINNFVRRYRSEFSGSRTSPDAAIEELNERFKEHRIGFQFCEGQILRIDSEFTHQEITMPALNLLQQPHLHLANQEFLAAHEHHRHGRYKECLNECLKAFESTMKAICHKRKWPYSQNDTAKPLIEICISHNLLPVFMQSHLTGLRTTLESGVPTARNKTSGHGQGVTPITVSEEFASYVLHLTAANIRFLAASEQALK